MAHRSGISTEKGARGTPKGAGMPKRTDVWKMLLIGPRPIVVLRVSWFDYSYTQSCKALPAEGFEFVLVNSNPATTLGMVDLCHLLKWMFGVPQHSLIHSHAALSDIPGDTIP